MAKRPLKVLHICQRDDSSTGGAVRVAVEYVNRLHQYSVDAHCLFLYGQPGHFQALLKERAHYLNIRDSKEIWKFGRLLKFIRCFNPDIVHHHDSLMWSHLFTLVHPSYRKISHAHLDTSTSTSPIKGRLTAFFQKQSVDALVCIAKSVQEDYLVRGQYPKLLTHVIANGVDRAAFYPVLREEKDQAKLRLGLQPGEPVVGYVGRLECNMKGVDDFIRVLAELPMHIKGLIVGDGPDREKLERLARELDVANRVRFTGNINQTQQAYCAMDVFCLTSHREPFGLTVVEAMACGIPVVGFPCVGGVNEILNETTGFSLSIRDHKTMAKTVIGILTEGISMQKQKNVQRKIATDYCWDKSTKKLAFLYQSIV